MILRPYQREAIEAIDEAFIFDDSALLVLPTGCGKTVVFASAIRDMRAGTRCLVLAHREELIAQAARKIEEVTGAHPQIEMAESYANESWLGWMHAPTHTVVSSVQTLSSSRMLRFLGFDFIVIDEAHHAPAESYRRIVEHFRRVNPDLKVLGVTATPDRADELALKSVFQTTAFEYQLDRAIKDGWLVPVVDSSVEVHGLDYSKVRTTAGDLNGRDLERVLQDEKVLHQFAHPTYEIVGKRKAIVFCASVDQATKIAEILNRWETGCAAIVSGKTQKDERKRMLRAFSQGKPRIICNCGVLTEGFDDPGVEVVVLARPTKSRALYAQMVGRGTRPLPGLVDGPETAAERRAAIAASPKPQCEVVDFVGNSGRHKLVTMVDILGGKQPEPVRLRAEELIRAGGRAVDVADAIEQAREQIEAERKRAEEERVRREEEKAREKERRKQVLVATQYSKTTRDPFAVLGIERREPRLSESFDAPISQRQAEMLAKAGIDPTGLGASDARALCGEIVARLKDGRCTYKQARILARNGFDPNTTKAEASRIIDRIFTKKTGLATRPQAAPVSSSSSDTVEVF